ncbi:MAG: hypothetical protein L6R19_26500 [Alphaproteobacteria bacterium]|nr:hypothetical protein [Alphaproteobacteria bacterium]
MIPGSDFFGDAVDDACRLGEDLARRGESPLTPAAWRALADKRRWRFHERRYRRADTAITAYKLLYRRAGL